MPLIRQALASSEIDPALLTAAERIQHDGFLTRQENNKVVRDLAKTGVPIKEITCRTGRSRKLVRSILRGEHRDVFRCRSSTLDNHLGKLGAEWDAACRNGAERWRRLRVDGFKGGLRVVTEWATRQRRNEKAGQGPSAPPPARKLSHLMTMRCEQLTKAEAVTVVGVEAGVPALAAARKMLHRFHRMIRTRNAAALTSWLADSETGLLASFCKGIRADLAVVTAALTEPWSNGQTEGQITRLKLVKRQIYGRAGLDLLHARLVGVA